MRQVPTSTATNVASDERLLTREQLAQRWGCHPETIRRKGVLGILTPVKLGPRLVRYRLSEILRLEEEATS